MISWIIFLCDIVLFIFLAHRSTRRYSRTHTNPTALQKRLRGKVISLSTSQQHNLFATTYNTNKFQICCQLVFKTQQIISAAHLRLFLAGRDSWQLKKIFFFIFIFFSFSRSNNSQPEYMSDVNLKKINANKQNKMKKFLFNSFNSLSLGRSCYMVIKCAW